MADITTGYTWVSGETVTPGKLNQTVNDATISGITNSDIDANASISLSKLNLGSGISGSQLADGAVTGAAGGGKLAASAITGQTTIADALADTDEFLVHDASAAALRKVAYSNISPTVTAAKLNGVAKDGSGNNLSAGNPPVFGCRAWVNFNGTTSPPTIRASGNVSSVSKTAAGDYTITFTTAMPDANYSVVITTVARSAANNCANGVIKGAETTGATTKTTTQLAIQTGASSSPLLVDNAEVNVCIFR